MANPRHQWGTLKRRRFFFLDLHVKAFLKAMMYTGLQLKYNVMDVLNVVMFYLIIISQVTNEFLPGDDTD